jgi:hypothetical protein
LTDSPEWVGGSFRDPAGRLYRDGDRLHRTVADWFEPEFQAFLDSGLYAEFVDDGLIVPHEELDPATAPAVCARHLRVSALPFITYPWEWSASQLRAAANLTLELQLRALERGLALRDASAFNVQFRGHQPVFIDTLSFARAPMNRPWQAYGQFCRHFLAPLALRTRVDPRLGDLQQQYLDGIPIDLASRLLPGRTKLSPGLGVHLHAHARSSRRAAAVYRPVPDVKVGPLALRGTAEQLRRTIRSLAPSDGRSTWTDYESSLSHYDQTALFKKRETIERWAQRISPARTVDLGSNRGAFSRLVASRGSAVLAIDADHATVDLAFREITRDSPVGGSVLPIRVNLLSPTPDLGWANGERDALVRRTGADLVLALALIHHLSISGEVPLEQAVTGLAEHGRIMAIEWVPPEDPKVAQLLTSRREAIRGYEESNFLASLTKVGKILETVDLGGGGRSLHLVQVSR